MPQKKNSQSHVQKKLTPIKNWYHTHTQQFYIVTGITLALTALLLTWQLPIHKERTMYQNAEKQITQFVDEAAQLAPSTKEVRKYCSYSSEKFSRGSLGCTIRGRLLYKDVSEEEYNRLSASIRQLERQLQWNFSYDNTKQNADRPYIKSIRVYRYESMTCGPTLSVKSNTDGKAIYEAGRTDLTLSVSCTGSALKKYY